MPFEVFRRHQRKLLATFAIMAMFAFVVSDSLTRFQRSDYSGKDQKVAELNGKAIYQSQLNDLARQRNRANLFVSGMSQFMPREAFGGLKQRDLVDALILQKEADRLGIPATAEMGREWLRRITGGRMDAGMWTQLYSRFSSEISEEHLLADIANQVRLGTVRGLLGGPIVTPYDVFRSYRDQNERIGAKVVEIPVAAFLDKVPEPSATEVQALYDQYKDVLPDPSLATPGFKTPRQIQVEILSLDGNALTRGIRDKLTEAELRSFYENHKTEFEVPSELPKDLFADQPDLTPPILQSFADVRALLGPRLAEERANAEILDRFTRVKDTELIPFADEYLKALEDQEDSKKASKLTTSSPALPTPADLKALADREHFSYEKTDLMSREEAERHGQVSTAEVGLTPLSGGRKFSEEMFDSKTGLFEPVELTDILGTRFLVRKVKDEPPHVPTLDQVRSQVATAWKLDRARPLAQKAAEDLAKQVESKGGAIKDQKFEGHRVLTIPPITRTQMNFLPSSMFDPSASTMIDTPIPDVPHAGETFREAYFSLRPGSVAVAPNQPKSVYYVLTSDRHEPAAFASLYAASGDSFRYKNMALESAAKQQTEQWMSWLRQQAGLPADWIPPDEIKKDDSASR